MKQEIRDFGPDFYFINITGALECVYSGDTLDSFLAEVTENIADIKQKYIKDYHTRHVLHRDHTSIYLTLYRLETDEEYQDRLKMERILQQKAERKQAAALQQKAAKQAEEEAIERAEYERLKQKYGN